MVGITDAVEGPELRLDNEEKSPHGHFSTYIVKFVVEATGITHRLSILISSPQSCCGGFAVGATCTLSPCRGLKNRPVKQLVPKNTVFIL